MTKVREVPANLVLTAGLDPSFYQRLPPAGANLLEPELTDRALVVQRLIESERHWLRGKITGHQSKVALLDLTGTKDLRHRRRQALCMGDENKPVRSPIEAMHRESRALGLQMPLSPPNDSTVIAPL